MLYNIYMHKLEVFNRRNRILLNELSKTDFKLRYQGSILGYLWAIIRPFLMFGTMYLVFAKFLRFGDEIPHYPVYLLVGTVLWNFFIECTNQGIQSLLIRSDLMRKIAFPKWIIVLSATTTALINLGINFVVIILFSFFPASSQTLAGFWFRFLFLNSIFYRSVSPSFLVALTSDTAMFNRFGKYLFKLFFMQFQSFTPSRWSLRIVILPPICLC